jgi:hypothetical protein
LETLTAPLICSRLGLWLGQAPRRRMGLWLGRATAPAAGPGGKASLLDRLRIKAANQAPLARRARTGQMGQVAAPACRQRRGLWRCKPSGPDHEAMHPGPIALFILLISFRNFQQFIFKSIDISLC